jgi:hypothetical protein
MGVSNEDSNIDLLVIKETKETLHRGNVNARKLVFSLRKGYGLDIGDQFLQEIVSRGKVLYG